MIAAWPFSPNTINRRSSLKGSRDIRAAAIEHLRNHSVPPPTSRLIPILDSDPDWNVRYAIVETLAHIPSEDDAHNALNALKNAAQRDPHPKVAAKAQSILYGEQ